MNAKEILREVFNCICEKRIPNFDKNVIDIIYRLAKEEREKELNE